MYDNYDDPMFDEVPGIGRYRGEPDFADPGGKSALRRATQSNPRNRSCPTCKRRNVLTPADVAHGYCCDICADRAENGWDY
mgnify:CR=1 FL=1